MNTIGGGQRDTREVGPIYLERLRVLHTTVLNVSAAYAVSAGDIVDALKQLAELVIWGDVNDYDAIFEYFCEENLMEFLTTVLPKSPFKVVRIQLIQTMSMMIHNLENERTLYFLLSNNYINTLITTSDLYSGGDISSWAASLLKTLSGLLNSTTIKFFYQEGNENFPLLEESLKLLSSSDSMKCAHVMTIILNIMRINDPSVTRYILERSHILAQLALYLRTCWRRLNRQIKRSTLESVGQTETILLTTCDDVFQFLQDVMDLANDDINKVLLQRIFTTCFFPLVGTVLREMEHDVSLIESLDVPQEPQCNFYRETYQKLMILNGLVGVYANNKSDIFTGNNIDASWGTKEPNTVLKQVEMETTRGAESNTASPVSTPRSKTQYLEMNMSATLLTNELLPNVAYYLLVTHLAAARRDDIRHYLLLLTQCPFAPRIVLERVLPFNNTIQSANDPHVTPRDSAVESGKDEGYIFDSIKGWERLVFGKKSFQHDVAPNCESKIRDKTDYVLNVVMGEFVRVAVCDLPRNDNRFAMLMALLHSLQNSFMKRAPTSEAVEGHPFEGFIAVPSTSSGLHIVLQLLNSMARYLNSPRLRVHVLNMALSIARNNTDIVERYNHKELPSFTEELRFHLDSGLNSVKLLLTAELERCTTRHISAFYDEWLWFDKGPSRRVDILDYPQVLLDASREPVEEAEESKAQSTPSKSPSQTGRLGPSGQPTPAETSPIATAVKGKDLNGSKGTSQSTRSQLSTWLFGSEYRPGIMADYFNMTNNYKSDTSEPRTTVDSKNDPWRMAQDPISIFRRHTQVALLIKDINSDLATGNMTSRDVKPSSATSYDRCPLFKDQPISLNGTILKLGAIVSLDNVHKYPCTMLLDGSMKRRYMVSNSLFFLLFRGKAQTHLFEATSIHPLWNVQLKKADTRNLKCIMTVTWYPDQKTASAAGISYSQPTRKYSVTDVELIFEREEDLIEYIQRFNKASIECTNMISGILRDYFMQLE